MLAAANPRDGLNDHVLHADLNRPAATGAAIELLRDGADEPHLVALGIQASQARPGIWQSVELLHVLSLT